MVSTVYKGDLSEVTFGKESGLVLAQGGFGGTGLVFTTGNASNRNVLTFSGANGGFFDSNANLLYPVGMLVGSELRIIGGGAFSGDDFATTGNSYTIVANKGATITLDRDLKTAASTASTSGDELVISTIATPTIDTGMTYNAQADLSDESVLTDQFVGLAATVALPETKVEIRRSHIVGIGRDVVIQEPQRFENTGGSMEMMFNSARWLYYSLGREVVDEPSQSKATLIATVDATNNFVNISAGDTYFKYEGTLSATPAVGDYILIIDGTATNFPSDLVEPASGSLWGANGTGVDMQNTERNEMRQVLYVDTATQRIHVDEPFYFTHTGGNGGYEVKSYAYLDNGASNGSPNFDPAVATYGNITNRVSRLLFSGPTLPTFALESSIRTRDAGSYNANTLNDANEGAPGSASDSKQLTRVWKGCKVKDFSLAADADAEVKLTVNFDALYCYTDTGRLESSDKGDRYTAHRMFENIANGPLERKKAGIAPNTEKPFFFYNGQITSFGTNIAQVTNFALEGNNNTEAIYTIRGNSQAEDVNSAGDSLEQIPFGGSRNANLMIEKKMEYSLSMTVIASDPLIWHEFRSNRSHSFTEPITLTLTKAGAGSNREQVIIVIDDYMIESAPLPIPEDKGVIKSELKIMPKHVRVISHDAFLHM
jgi:hypothetical protein